MDGFARNRFARRISLRLLLIGTVIVTIIILGARTANQSFGELSTEPSDYSDHRVLVPLPQVVPDVDSILLEKPVPVPPPQPKPISWNEDLLNSFREGL